MRRSSIVVLAIVIVGLLIIGLYYMGFIPGLAALFPGGTNDTPNEDAPPGAEYCGYTDLQILNMIELISGKDLNNQQGLTFVDALNMQACGQNNENYVDVMTHYKVEYVDWYIIGEQSYSGSGWNADSVAWGNDPSNPTSMKMVVSGGGVSVNELYGYNTMTITSHGTYAGYQAFVLWLLAS